MNAPRAAVARGMARGARRCLCGRAGAELPRALCAVLSCTLNGVFERRQGSDLQRDVSEGE